MNFLVVLGDLAFNLTMLQFGISELQFLGHVVTEKGIKIKCLPSKVEAIQKYLLLKTSNNFEPIWKWLIFTIVLSTILASCLALLNEYLKKHGNSTLNKINWTEKARIAFSKSKNLVAQSALLVYPKRKLRS